MQSSLCVFYLRLHDCVCIYLLMVCVKFISMCRFFCVYICRRDVYMYIYVCTLCVWLWVSTGSRCVVLHFELTWKKTRKAFFWLFFSWFPPSPRILSPSPPSLFPSLSALFHSRFFWNLYSPSTENVTRHLKRDSYCSSLAICSFSFPLFRIL